MYAIKADKCKNDSAGAGNNDELKRVNEVQMKVLEGLACNC